MAHQQTKSFSVSPFTAVGLNWPMPITTNQELLLWVLKIVVNSYNLVDIDIGVRAQVEEMEDQSPVVFPISKSALS